MNKLKLIIYKIKSHSKATQIIFVGLLVVLFAVIIMGIFLIINANMRVNGFIIEGECPYTPEQLAEYAGIELSQKFGKINYKEAEQDILESAFFVKEVKVSRNNMTKIKFVVIADNPVYYSKIAEEYYLLSSDFRILARSSGKLEIEGKGLIGIKFPTLYSAIVGQYPNYTEQYNNYEYINKIMQAVDNSELKGRINAYDFSDKFSIKLVCDNLFLIKLGNSDNLDAKIKAINSFITPEKTMEGIIAQLNVSDPGELKYTEYPNENQILSFD